MFCILFRCRRGKPSINTSSDSGRRNHSYSRIRSSSRDNSYVRNSSKTSHGRNSSRGSYQHGTSNRDSSYSRENSFQSQHSRGRSISNGDGSLVRGRSASKDSLERGRSLNRSSASHRERSLSLDRSRERSWASRRSHSPSAAGLRLRNNYLTSNHCFKEKKNTSSCSFKKALENPCHQTSTFSALKPLKLLVNFRNTEPTL